MINNLRSIGVLGAVYVACATVGTAQAAGPDDRAEARGPGAISAETRPAAVALAAPVTPTITSADDGFAWDDAAVSAAATLAVGALLGAGAVSIRYRRSLSPR